MWVKFYDRYIWKHQTQVYLNIEEIYSTAQILRNSSRKGIAKIASCINLVIIQYFSNSNLVSELQDLELPEKKDSRLVKFDTSHSSTIATVS